MQHPSNLEKPTVYAIATMDTKGAELAFVADQIRAQGVPVRTVDVGTLAPPTTMPDVAREVVAACHPRAVDAVLTQSDRGRAVESMSKALREYLTREHVAGRVLGVVGLGGSGGTALISPAMQMLPVGLPKIMVSTVAGGNVAAYVGSSDLVMFPSIVDIAGLNSVSRQILANAACALIGMVTLSATRPTDSLSITNDRPAIGMTMFGVTTPCVNAVRITLEGDGFDPLVFHATGTGGRSMDKLVESKLIQGVLDITTTEVADEIVGGIFAAGPDRFDAIVSAGVPYVMSLGALDMVNFGAVSTVPEKFRDRLFHVHNPQITLMRTTADENGQFARWIAAKVNQSRGPLTILIPEKGVSSLDAPGQPFYDPQADEVLFAELERAVTPTPNRTLRRLPFHINDPEFSTALIATFRELWSSIQGSRLPHPLES